MSSICKKKKKKENTTWKRINYKYVQVNSHIYPICIISLYITWVRISTPVLHTFGSRSDQYTRTLFRIIISVVRKCKCRGALAVQRVHNNFFLNTLKIATSQSTALNHRTPHSRREAWWIQHIIPVSCVLSKSVSLFKPVA